MKEKGVINDLFETIESYLNSSKNRSLHRLSIDSGVPYVTLRRIMQHEVQTTTIETCLKTLRVFMPISDILAFCKKHYGEMGDVFEAFSTETNTGSLTEKEIEPFFCNYQTWVVISLSEDQGVEVKTIEKILGVIEAEKAIGALDKAGFLEYKNNKIYLKNKGSLFCDPDLILSEIRHSARIFDTRNTGKEGHHMASSVRGWNKRGLEYIKSIYREAELKIAAASKQEEYSGKIKAFNSSLLGLFPNQIEGER